MRLQRVDNDVHTISVMMMMVAMAVVYMLFSPSTISVRLKYRDYDVTPHIITD